MILADKIIRLRKQNSWSQGELAEKMNVSRQSVSKWESANSIPDLNKILLLGEIFGVSTDFLVKDEIEEVESIREYSEPSITKITLEQASQYVEKKIEVSKLISKGVFLCISSIVPLLLLLALVEGQAIELTSNTAAAIGFVLLFAMIAIAVSIFVRSNQYKFDFSKIENSEFELVYGVKSIFKEKLVKYNVTYHKWISIGITMFLISAVPLLLAAFLDGSSMVVLMMVVVLILTMGMGVIFIIRVSQKYNAYSRILGEGDFTPERKKEINRIGKFAGFYLSLVTAFYVGWSLWTMDWGRTWIVWPVAAIGFVAFSGLMFFLEKE